MAGVAGSGLAQGMLVVTDAKPARQEVRPCMVSAGKALSGTGLVIETAGGSVIGSNEDRTITIRCDIPNIVLFVEAFHPGDKDRLDPIEAAFAVNGVAQLIASQTRSHQYSVDCARGASCEIDPAAVCRQAYPVSKAPSAKVLAKYECKDAQGAFTCSVDYDLNCN